MAKRKTKASRAPAPPPPPPPPSDDVHISVDVDQGHVRLERQAANGGVEALDLYLKQLQPHVKVRAALTAIEQKLTRAKDPFTVAEQMIGSGPQLPNGQPATDGVWPERARGKVDCRKRAS